MKSLSRVVCTLMVFFWVLGMAGAMAADKASPSQRINVNTASETELVKLPGIGPAKAKAIMEYRQEAPFRTVDDLKEVRGIGDATVESLRDQVTVGTK